MPARLPLDQPLQFSRPKLWSRLRLRISCWFGIDLRDMDSVHNGAAETPGMDDGCYRSSA